MYSELSLIMLYSFDRNGSNLAMHPALVEPWIHIGSVLTSQTKFQKIVTLVLSVDLPLF